MRGARRLAIAACALALGAAAQGLHPPFESVALGELRWLGRLDEPAELLARPARNLVRPLSEEAALGELLFRSPWLLGGAARRLSLSCDTCHPQGHRNARFFFPGVSDRPGTFDPTNAVFNPAKDDGHFAPLDIPSLRGAAARVAFGQSAREPSLGEFVRVVIVDEFAGEAPSEAALAALVAYVSAIGETTRPDEDARLDDDVARLGRSVRLIAPLLDKDEVPLAQLAVASVRSELGRLHERFAAETLAIEREILEGMALALGAVADAIEIGEIAEAKARLGTWLVAFEDFDRDWLLAAEAETLYNPGALGTFLGSSRK
jgi:cytochrome c peroxidase